MTARYMAVKGAPVRTNSRDGNRRARNHGQNRIGWLMKLLVADKATSKANAVGLPPAANAT